MAAPDPQVVMMVLDVLSELEAVQPTGRPRAAGVQTHQVIE